MSEKYDSTRDPAAEGIRAAKEDEKKRLMVAAEKAPGGCPDCGMAYSFFFNEQFHKTGCSLA